MKKKIKTFKELQLPLQSDVNVNFFAFQLLLAADSDDDDNNGRCWLPLRRRYMPMLLMMFASNLGR